MENEKKLTLWSRAAIAAVWLRDSFASWFTTAWLYLILWGVVLIAFSVLLYIDGIFSRSLAPDSIQPLSFQAMGWAYRFFAAAFLMAATRCRIKGIEGIWTFRVLGIFASTIVCLHAFGFGFEALSDKRDNAEIITAAQENVETDVQAYIDQLNDQSDKIRDDLAVAVAPLSAEVQNLDTDGKRNEDLATIQKEQRAALQDAAQEKIDKNDALILEALRPPDQDVAETAKERAEAEFVEKWHPLFVGLAQAATGSWEPTDNQIYIAAIVFIIFWVLLAESLVIFLPERIYVMHMHDAASAKTEREVDEARSAASKKGWETRKARDRAPKKIAQAGTKSDIHNAEYWNDAVSEMLAWRENTQPKVTMARLVEKFGAGRAEGEFMNGLRMAVKNGWVSQQKYDQLNQTPAVANGAANTGVDDADNDVSSQLN